MNEADTIHHLPVFDNGVVVNQNEHFRVVMGYKPGKENITDGQRFYIEPLTDDGEQMLKLAIQQHHNPYKDILTSRDVPMKSGEIKSRICVRANFDPENIPTLLLDQTIEPAAGETSMPSLKRMEECIALHPNVYTFYD